MADNLKELIAKMKQENSQTTQGSASIKQKPKAKPIEEEIEEEYNEEIDGDEDDPVENKMNINTKVAKKVPQETEEVSLADQIRNLHDDGIFRLELLGVLHQINNNLRIVAGVLADYKK